MLSQTDFNKKANNGQSLHVYLTEHCNLQCKHCFLSASPHRKRSLNWNQIKTLLDTYHQNGSTSVNFSGGEALTSPHLNDAIIYAKHLGYKNITVATNGISSAIFNLPYKNKIQLFFSLDGISPNTHDAIRGAGTFEKTIKNIEKATKLGYAVFVNFTVNKINQKEIIPLIYFLDSIKVSTIGFNFLSLKGRAKNNHNLSITPQAWKKIYNQVVNITDLKHSTLRIPPGFLTQKEIGHLKFQDIKCLLFAPNRIEVTPSGQLFHCCLLVDTPEYQSGIITSSKVYKNRKAEKSLLKNYGQKTYCPARLMEFPNMTISKSPSKLIPVCFYYRTVIEPKN